MGANMFFLRYFALLAIVALVSSAVAQSACALPDRYVVQTVSYPSDETGNTVLDKRTGVQWRRCEEGQRWDGRTCQGQARPFTHEQALRHAASLSLWRIPDIKQLGSLPQRTCRFPALEGPMFVTGGLSLSYWSSTPFIAAPALVWLLEVNTGRVIYGERSDQAGLRMIGRY